MNARIHIVLATLVLLAALSGDGFAQKIYWTQAAYMTPEIGSYDLATHETIRIELSRGSLPEGITYSARSDRVYFVEAAGASADVHAASFDLSTIDPLGEVGSTYHDIAIDERENTLYWTSFSARGGARIYRARPDGEGMEIFHQVEGDRIGLYGIDVDSEARVLYWMDSASNRIRRTDLESREIRDLVALPERSSGYGLALDRANGHLYWTEHNTGSIRRAGLDGSSPVTILSGLQNPTHLALSSTDDRLVWIEAAPGVQSIRTASLSGRNLETLDIPYSSYGGIALVPSASRNSTPSEPVVTRFALAPIQPNPSIGPAVIQYAIPRAAPVRVRVFDVLGRQVADLVDATQEPGRYSISWDGFGPRGRIAAGMYFVSMEAPGVHLTQRLVWLR